MKYVVFVIGWLLSVAGYVGLDIFGRAMANSDPGYSSTEYVLIICFGGVLPLICGIIMCFLSTKKWLRDRRRKMDLLKDEDAVAAAAAEAAARKMKRNVIQATICFMVPETIILFLVLDWIGIPWLEEWPLTLLFFSCVMFATLLGAYWGLVMGRRIGETIVSQTRGGKR